MLSLALSVHLAPIIFYMFSLIIGCLAHIIASVGVGGWQSLLMYQVSGDMLLCVAVITTHRLTKDTAKWGLLEDDGGTSVFYVFWPPWTTHRAVVPEQLAGPVPTYTKPPHVSLACACLCLCSCSWLFRSAACWGCLLGIDLADWQTCS